MKIDIKIQVTKDDEETIKNIIEIHKIELIKELEYHTKRFIENITTMRGF